MYLSNSQLNKISNISLVRKIESDDKYYENDVSYAKTNYLIVTTFSGYHLQSNEELYSIQMQFAENSYIVRIDRNGLTEGDFLQKKKRTIKFLTKISEVKTVTPFMKPVLHNVISSGYTQKNSFEFKQLPGQGYFYLDRYLNANGINGEGEVITILYTIIDYTHSMFRDDDVSVQLNTKLDNHRKFVYYGYDYPETFIDDMFDDEHGTHTAATMAGKSVCQVDNKNISYFNGVAPEAKILYGG